MILQVYLNKRGANSYRLRLHDCHSWPVSGETYDTALIPILFHSSAAAGIRAAPPSFPPKLINTNFPFFLNACRLVISAGTKVPLLNRLCFSLFVCRKIHLLSE